MAQRTYTNQPTDLRFTSRRSPVLATRGMVSCSQPLAAEAGLSILKAGGNAIDAAIATAAALAVCEPCSTGLGGDAFILRYDAATQKVEGLNGSGRAPRALSVDRVRQDCGEGLRSVPHLHPHACTVPGAAGAWCDAAERWGSLPLSSLLEPAVRLAEEGFPVTPITAYSWKRQEAALRQQHAAQGGRMPPGLLVEDPSAQGGVRAPCVGEIFRNAALGSVLRELGDRGKRDFYTGRAGTAIVAALQRQGGVMAEDDLREHCEKGSTWDEPVHASYHGVEVYECAPNGQGLTALAALSMLDGLSPAVGSSPHGSAAHLHPLVEALRLAFADSRWFVADPEHVKVPTEALLSSAYVAARRALIDPAKATADPHRGAPEQQTNTVSFQVVDAAGCAVSMVNSNFCGFGTAIVPQGCGFSLQNRGSNFSLEPAHPNALVGGRRPFHTIIPAIVLKGGALFASLTNMGGFMQPQGHVQLLVNMIDYGMEPQVRHAYYGYAYCGVAPQARATCYGCTYCGYTYYGMEPQARLAPRLASRAASHAQAAIDAPRFCIDGANTDDPHAQPKVFLEAGIGADTAEELRRMGHVIAHDVSGHDRDTFGRAQIIQRLPTGVLWGGSDGRSDGMAIGW